MTTIAKVFFAAGIACASLACVSLAPAEAMHSYRHKINATFYTKKRLGSFFCRVTIAGKNTTKIGPCGPVLAQ